MNIQQAIKAVIAKQDLTEKRNARRDERYHDR